MLAIRRPGKSLRRAARDRSMAEDLLNGKSLAARLRVERRCGRGECKKNNGRNSCAAT
jgi:hypothetical protein